MNSWLQIVDDALKIGLGALGGIVTSYFSFKSSRKQEYVRRRRELIERASMDIQTTCNELYVRILTLSKSVSSGAPVADREKILNDVPSFHALILRLAASRASIHLVQIKEAEEALFKITQRAADITASLNFKDLEKIAGEIAVQNHSALKYLAEAHRKE